MPRYLARIPRTSPFLFPGLSVLPCMTHMPLPGAFTNLRTSSRCRSKGGHIRSLGGMVEGSGRCNQKRACWSFNPDSLENLPVSTQTHDLTLWHLIPFTCQRPYRLSKEINGSNQIVWSGPTASSQLLPSMKCFMKLIYHKI